MILEDRHLTLLIEAQQRAELLLVVSSQSFNQSDLLRSISFLLVKDYSSAKPKGYDGQVHIDPIWREELIQHTSLVYLWFQKSGPQ